MSEVSLRQLCLKSRSTVEVGGESASKELCADCQRDWDALSSIFAGSGSAMKPGWGSREEVDSWGKAFALVSTLEMRMSVSVLEIEAALNHFDSTVVPYLKQDTELKGEVEQLMKRIRNLLTRALTFARMSKIWIQESDLWALHLANLYPQKSEDSLFSSGRELALFFRERGVAPQDLQHILLDEEIPSEFESYFGYPMSVLVKAG